MNDIANYMIPHRRALLLKALANKLKIEKLCNRKNGETAYHMGSKEVGA